MALKMSFSGYLGDSFVLTHLLFFRTDVLSRLAQEDFFCPRRFQTSAGSLGPKKPYALFFVSFCFSCLARRGRKKAGRGKKERGDCKVGKKDETRPVRFGPMSSLLARDSSGEAPLLRISLG